MTHLNVRTFLGGAPRTRIHTINLIECGELGLMARFDAQALLERFLAWVEDQLTAGQLVLGDPDADEKAVQHLNELLRAVAPAGSTRPVGAFPASLGDELRTVTAWAGFKGRNRAAMARFESSSDLAGLLPPLAAGASEDQARIWLADRASVLIEVLEKAGGFKFVPSPRLTIWIAPTGLGGSAAATELRNRLGVMFQ